MKLKIKKLHPNAVIPKYATNGSAGFDLVAVDKKNKGEYIEYDIGLGFEIPVGYVGLVFPRSSVSNYSLSLCNCVGVIDSDYRGSVLLRFRYLQMDLPIYQAGDRVGQMVIVPINTPEIEVVEELNNTERGSGGFGSTGT